MDDFEKLYYETMILLFEERIQNKINIDENLKQLKIFLNKLYLYENKDKIKHPQYERYTERQIEIIGMVKKGLTNKEISEEAYISYNTVKKHIRNIMSKGSLKNRAEIIIKL